MAPIATIPSIPLSPVAKAWLLCRTNLEQADTALSKAKNQSHPTVSVSVLRKLIEDVKVERHRYDNLGRQMQSVQTATAFQWTPDALAKQIAVIDCQLFGMVKLEKSFLCQTDLTQTHLDRLLDFHHYLTNSFAHQLIFWSSLTKSTSTETMIPPVRPKDNMISHLVQVAHGLLHTYRDFSGFVAIMKALMLPQVRRLRSLWKNCPSRIKEMYNEMVPILSPDQHYQAYHNVLCQKLSYFFFTATQSIGTSLQPSSSSSSSTTTTTTSSSSTLPRMVVIPWMQPHLISIRSIVTDYAAMGNDTPSDNLCHQNIDLVLSAPGLQKLAVVMALLEQCQTCSASSSLSNDFVLSSSSIDILEDYMRPWRQDHSDGRRSRRQSMVSSTKTTVCDLHILFPGDLLVHHWLVSRVYLRMDQLVDESIQIQPLLDGEQLICDTYSPDDACLIAITTKTTTTTSSNQLVKPSDSQSPVITATFAGWKSMETTQGNDNININNSNSNSNSDNNNSNSDNNNSSRNSNNNNNNNNKTSLDGDHINEADNDNNINAIDSVPQTNTEEERPTVDEMEQGKVTTLVEDTNQPDTVKAPDTVTQSLLDGNTNKEDDTADHTLTTVSTLASTAASLSSSSSTASTSSSVSVIIIEPVRKAPLEEPENDVTTNSDATDDQPSEQKQQQQQQQQQQKEQQQQQQQQQQRPTSLDSGENSKHSKKSKLSPTAPEFVPLLAQPHYENIPSSVAVTPSSSIHDGSISKKRNGYIPTEEDEWNGYPTPTLEAQRPRPREEEEEDEEDEDEVWTGYPGPKRRGSLQSVLSDEWKGYQAAKMEATWELETALKVQQHDWQGYALETLNEEDPENS